MEWSQPGDRKFRTGCDRGVLLAEGDTVPVPWNGLVNVTEEVAGAEHTPLYFEGQKYLDYIANQDAAITLECFTYPLEFEKCDGIDGIYSHQRRRRFNLSWRTLIGNDEDGINHGYNLHLLYNATALPSKKAFPSVGDVPELQVLSYAIHAVPEFVEGIGPATHISISSVEYPEVVEAIEEILYGDPPIFPTLPDVVIIWGTEGPQPAPPPTTFTGSDVTSEIAATSSTITAQSTATWSIDLSIPIQLSEFKTDIRAAGTYDLTIDGSVFKTGVVAASSPTANVVFTPAAPLILEPGRHEFQLIKQGTTGLFYTNTTNPAGLATGTGADFLAYTPYLEGSGIGGVPGKLTFKIADGNLVSKVVRTNTSTGNFAAQTWSVTFTTDILLKAVIKSLRDADASVGYAFKINGVTKQTVLRTADYGTNLVDELWLFDDPIALAAGSYTFSFVPSANRRWPYTAGTGTADSGSGSAYVSAWGPWIEANANQVPCRLIFALDV